MALQVESTYMTEHPRSLETWVWPMTAAIVVSGSLVFWSLIGMFWLATHPTRQSTVIWMQSAASQSAAEEQPVAADATIAQENRPDARTN